MNPTPAATMNAFQRQFQVFLASYRRDLSTTQEHLLMACVQVLHPNDRESFVQLVMLTQTLADPNARRSEMNDRLKALQQSPCAPLLSALF